MEETILEMNDRIFRRFDQEQLELIYAFYLFRKRVLSYFGSGQSDRKHAKGIIAEEGSDELSIVLMAFHRKFTVRLTFRKSGQDQLETFLIALERSCLSPEQFREVARVEFNLSGEATGLGTLEHGDPIKLTDKGLSFAAITGHLVLEALSHDPCGWV